MDKLKIPQFEAWHAEYEVYHAVDEFLQLANRLGYCQSSKIAPAISVLKKLMQLTRMQVPEIDVLFTILIDAVFAYSPPVYRELDAHPACSLFTNEDRTKWDKKRKLLKQNARVHTDIMVEMMDWQEKCWKSRDKMKQYVNMLECAQMSLPYYLNEERNFKARKYAIKQLKKDVKHKQKLHSKNTGEYHKLLQERDGLWKDMSRVSWELENEIQGRLKEKLCEAWIDLRRASHPNTFIPDLNMDEISSSIYSMTCRQYRVVHPPYDTSSSHFNVKIERPTMKESDFYTLQPSATPYGEMFNYNCTIEEETDEVADSFLKLKQGDSFILKMTSADHTVGFGYVKPSILAMKKWGFVFMSNVCVDSKIQKRSR